MLDLGLETTRLRCTQFFSAAFMLVALTVPYQLNSAPLKMLTGAPLMVIYDKTVILFCYSRPNDLQNKIS